MQKFTIIKIVTLVGIALILAVLVVSWGYRDNTPSQRLNENWYQNLDWQKIRKISDKATTTPEVTISGISGNASLGPTCPVMRIPPDPQCADRPYQGDFVATTVDGLKTISKFSSGVDGKFKVNLAPGEYIIKPADTIKMLPRCSESAVFKVVEGELSEVNISCDTGIR